MSAGANFPDHFSAAASSYAAFRPTYPAALVDALAEHASSRELAWDVGCGSGQLATALARRFTRVIATDASAAQIAQASACRGVEYRVARAEDSALDADSVDLVVAAQAAHWFALDAFYAEARRVARAGAVIALVSYGRVVLAEPMQSILASFYDGPLRERWPPERRHVDAEYRSLAFPFRELDAPPFALRETWDLARVLGYVETWSATQALRAVEPGVVDAWRAAMARAWGDAATRREVTWPLAVRVGSIER
ncbi:MAG: class I SAM-dependent methyltransferase [Planctomycetes bacterium]|nr:class I SAM-dependent methyltransferase [Planctomycetota bacterium]MCC7169275.1 class I SAM-dependent methyltransferase [Planctomycetota bacterium]